MAFKVITRESLWAAQREDLQKVMELLLVREHHARTLLIHYRWNVEKLITVYFEKGESRVFTEAGVTRDEFVVINKPESSSTVLCNVCMDDVASSFMTRMGCGHCFCNTCWTEHFIVKIVEGLSKRIRCMAHECNTICDEAVIRNLVSARNPYLAEKFERFLLESYIEDNKLVKWCPSIPHCGNAIRVDDEFCEVECCCGLQFCFSCLSEAHSPCSCSMWQLWRQKCRDESETVKWIAKNTMQCPKCHKAVERKGRCNLVICVCGQPLRWLYKSRRRGRYKENTEEIGEHAKRDLYRYAHYYNRYQAHSNSFQQESQLWELIQDKLSSLQSWDSKVRDFSWITGGFHRLLTSRRILSYSYPFAFYAFSDDFFKDETEKVSELKRHFIEDHQQQLEWNVEKLSEILEELFDEYSDEQFRLIRIQVIDLSRNADSLCRRMYECIQNELLGSHQHTIQFIAPYWSEGIEKAGDKCPKAAGHSSSKCPRHESSSSRHRVLEMCCQLSCSGSSCYLLQAQTQGTS